MVKICIISGKKVTRGSRILRRGQSKKSGGIGTHVTKVSPRTFRPNLQRVRIQLLDGQTKKVWVSVKMLKAGKVPKFVKTPKTQ